MPTTNPVPSTDPTDLLFNAGKLDEVVNGAANSFTDRLGVARRTVAGMNADFDAQLADAESALNVYRADAAASAEEALGYLQTIRATSYGAYASDPATDPLGNPPTVGDEYFNTTANLLKRWNGTTWQASDINTANLADSSGSSLIGYMPAGTGAVPTTVEIALNDTVNILRFCTGDGSTDESAKALLAVEHANNLKKALYVPTHANVLISGSTTLNPKYGMFGGGRISRGVTGWTGSAPMVLIDTDRQFVDNIRFVVNPDTSLHTGVIASIPSSGVIEISGSPKNVLVTNNYISGGRFGIWPYGADGVLISGNVIHTLSEIGVYVGYNSAYPKAGGGDVKNVTITNNRIYSISNALLGGFTGEGIKTVSNCYNLHIEGNHISDCRGDAIDTFSSGDRLRIVGNTLFNNQTKGIDIKSYESVYPPATWGYTRAIIVSNNHIYGNGIIGIQVAADGSSVNNILVTGNIVHDNSQWGIVFDGYACAISNNLVYGNGSHVQSYSGGIRIEGVAENHCRDVVVASNVCINNGCSGLTNSCGIVVFGYVDNVSITGNVCNSVAYLGNAGNQDYGIYISAEASKVKVAGNKCEGNSVLGIGMANNADVVGETATILVGDVSASRAVIIANMPHTSTVIRGRVIATGSVAADAANYWDFRLRKKSADGSVETGIVIKTTASTPLTAWTKFQFNTLPSLADKDETVFLQILKTGTPTNLVGLTAQLDYVSW